MLCLEYRIQRGKKFNFLNKKYIASISPLSLLPHSLSHYSFTALSRLSSPPFSLTIHSINMHWPYVLPKHSSWFRQVEGAEYFLNEGERGSDCESVFLREKPRVRLDFVEKVWERKWERVRESKNIIKTMYRRKMLLKVHSVPSILPLMIPCVRV